MLVLDVSYLTLFMQRLSKQTTKLLIAASSTQFCLITSGFAWKIRQTRVAWLATSNTVRGVV